MLVGPLLALGSFLGLLALGWWNKRRSVPEWWKAVNANRLMVLDGGALNIVPCAWVPKGQALIINLAAMPVVEPPLFTFGDLAPANIATDVTTGNYAFNMEWRYWPPSPPGAFKITGITT